MDGPQTPSRLLNLIDARPKRHYVEKIRPPRRGRRLPGRFYRRLKLRKEGAHGGELSQPGGRMHPVCVGQS